MEILKSKLLIKFSDYFDKFPQKNSNWNCGFAIHNNKYVFLCRNEVSKYSEKYWGKKLDSYYPRAVPTYAEFNFDNSLLCVSHVNKSEDYILSDVRLFNHKDILYSTGTYRSDKAQKDGKRRVDQFLARQFDNNLVFLPFEHSFPLPQKNWTPLLSDSLYFENYEQKTNCRDLLEYSGSKLRLVNRFHTNFKLRGNCQSAIFDGKLLSVYHFHKNRYYWHYLILSEPYFPFNPIRISQPFRFNLGNSEREPIQFVMGLEVKEDVFFSYGIQDSDNYLVIVSKNDIKKILD